MEKWKKRMTVEKEGEGRGGAKKREIHIMARRTRGGSKA